jgi:hypothetical protein
MKALLVSLISTLIFSGAMASCPDSINITFGNAQRVMTSFDSISLGEPHLLENLAGKSFTLDKVKGTRVCHYEGLLDMDVKVSFSDVLSFKTKDFTYTLWLEDQLGLESSKTFNTPRFDIFNSADIDEDGCMFGQVSCDPLDLLIKEVEFDFIDIEV